MKLPLATSARRRKGAYSKHMKNYKKTSRRNFLIGGAALTTLGALAVQLPAPAPGAQVLSKSEQEIVSAVAEAMFPQGFFPVSGAAISIVERFDLLLREHLDAIQRRGVRYLLRLLNTQSYAQHQQDLSSLDTIKVTALLQGWDHEHAGVQAMAMEALKALLAMAYFAEPAVLTGTGWTLGCGLANE